MVATNVVGLFYHSLAHPSGGARIVSSFAAILRGLGYTPIIITCELKQNTIQLMQDLGSCRVILTETIPKARSGYLKRRAVGLRFEPGRELSLVDPYGILRVVRREGIRTLILFDAYYLASWLRVMHWSLRTILYVFFPYSFAYAISSKETLDEPSPLRLICGRLEGLSYRLADLVLTLSSFSQQVLEMKLGVRSEVLSEPIDTEFLSPNYSMKQENLILSVSQFTPGKRIHEMIKWFGEIDADAKLTLAGALNPNYKGYFRMLKDLSRNDQRIELEVNPSDARLRELYQQARIYWHLREEHHILTPLEAMACGTPAVILEGGGLDGAIHNYNCFIARNKSEFLRYTSQLLSRNSPWAEMSRNCPKSIQFLSYYDSGRKLRRYLSRVLA